jgi:hypothetical protein
MSFEFWLKLGLIGVILAIIASAVLLRDPAPQTVYGTQHAAVTGKGGAFDPARKQYHFTMPDATQTEPPTAATAWGRI